MFTSLRVQKILCLSFAGTLVVSTLARVESWPFSDFAMFARQYELEAVEVFRLRVEGEAGQRWLYENEAAQKNKTFHGRTQTFARTNTELTLQYMNDHLEKARELKGYTKLVLIRQSLRIENGEVTGTDLEPYLWLPLE